MHKCGWRLCLPGKTIIKIHMTRKGFTLIELLIVIVIIGILSSLALVSFTNSQRQARDVKRRADLKEYTNVLQNYAQKRDGFYPHLGNGTTGAMCNYLNNVLVPAVDCPVDPVNDGNTYRYRYWAIGDGTGGSPTAPFYVLYARLEEPPQNYIVYCANGKVVERGSAPNNNFYNNGCPG